MLVQCCDAISSALIAKLPRMKRFSKRSTESGFQGFQERVSVSEWSSVSFVITLSMDVKSILIGSQHRNEKA